MASQASLCLLLSLFACFFFSSSVAYNFYVGGRDGWVLNPSEKYNDWAGRNRFQVNDTLIFKFKEGSDSVLLVKKDDYNTCNTNEPLKVMKSATSVFQFDRSGPFFFISGNKANCEKGQRLIIVVLAIRPKPTPKTPAPVSQPPLAHPPATSPVSPSSSPVPAVSPVSPSPISKPPSLAPSPHAKAPKLSPAPVESQSPSPSAITPTKAPSPAVEAPNSPSPANPPSVSSPAPSETSQPGNTTVPASSPDSGDTADINTPPSPSRSGSWALTPSVIMLFAASLLVSVTVGASPLGVY
ncbi:early nodulin-like protein 1 [Manihot esculenta]|uniref:Phytocyanin domain-containing protein n=1 Tax=Manihot esculenta TaxID=3983 RepID=A0A2C9W6E4_MANES|nr:early nodulin-like protein 1 [Manihot esculenta]OAY54877.1 hypothetical protein MANES_03G109200v8 [Manihot esculenta]